MEPRLYLPWSSLVNTELAVGEWHIVSPPSGR